MLVDGREKWGKRGEAVELEMDPGRCRGADVSKLVVATFAV